MALALIVAVGSLVGMFALVAYTVRRSPDA